MYELNMAGKTIVEEFTSSQGHLRNIIVYHLVTKKYLSSDMRTGDLIMTEIKGSTFYRREFVQHLSNVIPFGLAIDTMY